MKLSRLLTLTLSITGGLAAGRMLARRSQWEQQHNRVAICVDFDDLAAAAIRAGLPFSELLARLAQQGATHVSLPELTLNRLLQLGRLAPQAPAQPLSHAPRVGHWNYLHGSPELVDCLAEELAIRLPQTEAQWLEPATLAFAGDLPTVGEIGLGFEGELSQQIRQAGLGVVPRPVSYAWPQKLLLERTLSQAAEHGPLVAFAGDMILGHEMHLDETVAAMSEHGLSLVYFAESRFQRGDWFVAKRRAPHVVLAHQLTPQAMIPLDYHAAAHNWVNLARERGIRFCYINFFRVLHATAPLEGLEYVHRLKHALEDAGFVVTAEVASPPPIPTPSAADLALTGLNVGGLAAAAANQLLPLPAAVSLPLTIAAAGGAAALPFVEQAYQRARSGKPSHHHHDHDHHHHDHDEHEHHEHEHHEHEHEHHEHEHHEHDHHEHEHDHHDHGDGHSHDHGNLLTLYPPSYTPKLLALATAALAPIAALNLDESDDPLLGWLESALYPATAAATLAAVTSGTEYALRIESYRSYNLDWFVPLVAASRALPDRRMQAVALVLLGAGWLVARQRKVEDPLAAVDPGHAEGHTHHISAASVLLGDTYMMLGPQPGRKWAGLGPFGQGLSMALAGRGKGNGSAALAYAGTAGYILGLAAFRRPERPLQVTLRQALPSYGLGAALGLVLRWL